MEIQSDRVKRDQVHVRLKIQASEFGIMPDERPGTAEPGYIQQDDQIQYTQEYQDPIPGARFLKTQEEECQEKAHDTENQPSDDDGPWHRSEIESDEVPESEYG